jgi:bifunctional non-homologous end joining protein LigD
MSKYLPGKSKKLAHYIKPMLAKESNISFNDKDWIYEIKWDGYRAIAEVNKSKIKLYSRNGNTFNASYPIIVNELKELKINAVLDGEIVIVDENGKSNFQLLQNYSNDDKHLIQFMVFDLLSINKKKIYENPLIERKKLLEKLINKKSNVIKYSDHIFENGMGFFELAKENDLEGIIAKKADSQYHPGVRTNKWLKIKYHKSIEAVIAGFTEPNNSRKYFGALILGIWNKGKLQYIGHTGTGFKTKDLEELNKLFTSLIQKKNPFEGSIKTNTSPIWVKPVFVCEIKYSEWTNEGHLRHPVFLRLRRDKKATDITMDAQKPVKKMSSKNNNVKNVPV